MIVEETDLDGLVNTWDRFGEGTFNNNALITIGENKPIGVVGLVNNGTFNNNVGGILQIDSTSDHGLLNQSILVPILNITSIPMFTNKGDINIGSKHKIKDNGIYNRDTFYNQGQITIDDLTKSSSGGIYNRAGYFNNSNIISIGLNKPLAGSGISNFYFGHIVNEATGQISIDDIDGFQGIINFFGGIITNFGNIDVGKTIPFSGNKIENKANIIIKNGGAINLYK